MGLSRSHLKRPLQIVADKWNTGSPVESKSANPAETHTNTHIHIHTKKPSGPVIIWTENTETEAAQCSLSSPLISTNQLRNYKTLRDNKQGHINKQSLFHMFRTTPKRGSDKVSRRSDTHTHAHTETEVHKQSITPLPPHFPAVRLRPATNCTHMHTYPSLSQSTTQLRSGVQTHNTSLLPPAEICNYIYTHTGLHAMNVYFHLTSSLFQQMAPI